MNAIAFSYDVQKSFITGTRQITLPKSQVSYKSLKDAQLDQREYIIVYPKGESLPAWIHYGKAGYGPYYQLRVSSNQPNIPKYLQKDDRLIVILTRYYKHNYAFLEYIRKSKTRLWK